MDCFLKHVEVPEDSAIRGDFQQTQFAPFLLASLSGFKVPPSRAEIQFFVDLMFLCTTKSKQFAVCRNE